MRKTFTLRVDMESNRGIREGIPRLLDLLKKYNLKASFYVTMGGEANILEIIKYRRKIKSASERKVKVWSLLDKLRMILFPIDFVKSNKKILERIISEGHELGVHGWKHRAWTRGLDKIDIYEHLVKSNKKYIKLFGKRPESFCAPGFNVNSKVVSCLEREGFRFMSDYPTKSVRNYGKLKNVPITILGKNKTPFIEYNIGENKTDLEIVKEFEKELQKKEIVSFYIHDLYEARFKLDLLEKIFQKVKKYKLINKRIIDY